MRSTPLLVAAVLVSVLAFPAFGQGYTYRQDTNYFGLYYPESSLGLFCHRSMDEVGLAYSARSVAMGGARVALADDPSAIASNPAALTRIEGTQWLADAYALSGSGSASDFPFEYETPFGSLPVTGMIEKPGGGASFGFLGAARSFEAVGRPVVLGFGYRRYLDTKQPHETTIDFVVEASGQSAATTFAEVDEEEGGMSAYAPSVGFSIVPGISVGATANFITGDLTHSLAQTVSVLGLNVGTGFASASQEYSGFALDLGGLVEFGPVAVGVTVSPARTLEFRKGKYSVRALQTDQDQIVPLIEGRIRDYDLKIPLFAGAGIAVRPLSGLVVAADYQYRPWSEARLSHGGNPTDQELLLETINVLGAGDDFWGEIGGEGLDDIHEALRRPLLEDASSFHVGVEYELLHRHLFGVPYVLPIRAGFHTYPQTFRGVDPTDTLSVAQDGDGLFKADQVEGNAYTGGIGITMENVSFDLSYRAVEHKLTRWFIVTAEPVSSPFQRRVGTVKVTRGSGELRLSTTLRF